MTISAGDATLLLGQNKKPSLKISHPKLLNKGLITAFYIVLTVSFKHIYIYILT